MSSSAPVRVGGHLEMFAATERTDNWWVGPLAIASGLVLFFGYLTFRAFQATHVYFEPYISPTVAPPLFTPPPGAGYPGSVPVEVAWFGAFPSFWPSFLPQSPAFFLPALAILFRLTCYYYRKAGYRALAASPPACSVRGVKRPYRGETGLLVFQNLHRYALYGALFLLVCLWYEGLHAFFKDGQVGVGVGTIVMIINAALLSGYTFGCHSWRHLIGGKDDCFTCDGKPTTKLSIWKSSTWFNGRHMAFAWMSLVWVVFTDVYINLVSRGIIKDLNTWG